MLPFERPFGNRNDNFPRFSGQVGMAAEAARTTEFLDDFFEDLWPKNWPKKLLTKIEDGNILPSHPPQMHSK